MWLESEENEGSTFYVSIKANICEQNAESKKMNAMETAIKTYNKTKKSIVVIDSNEAQLLALSEYFYCRIREIPSQEKKAIRLTHIGHSLERLGFNILCHRMTLDAIGGVTDDVIGVITDSLITPELYHGYTEAFYITSDSISELISNPKQNMIVLRKPYRWTQMIKYIFKVTVRISCMSLHKNEKNEKYYIPK